MEYREKIKEYIKNHEGNASLADLKKLCENHQTCLYNIRGMLADGTIRPYIRADKKIKRSVGFIDDEIFFILINRYEYPQDVKKLIEEMCNNDTSLASQAFTEFINLCKEKGASEEQAKRLSYLLMSKAAPGLENTVAFSLTTDNKFPEGTPGMYLVGWNEIPYLQPRLRQIPI